jgi:excisionase family DNA binding protein
MSAGKLSVKDLAAYLNLPVETVYKYVRGGKLPASKSGRQWVFDRVEIDRWVEENLQTPGSAPCIRRVLVVDDEPAVRGVFSVWLESAGYAVEQASNGEQALTRLDEDDDGYDLVFLDLQMPKMNGVETLRHIRALEAPPDVVIVTAHYNGDLMEEILRMGPVHVLKKPVDRRQFLEAAGMYVPLP